MGTSQRQSDTSIIDKLCQEWYGFSFFQAVHLLETFFPEKERLGKATKPGKEAVRFSVRPGFSFPPSDLADFVVPEDEKSPVEMSIAFLGLIGPAGVMPDAYNEIAISRLAKKDHSLVAFFNIFHHRLITLFYLAWKKHQFPVNYVTGAKDNLSRYLLSLCGLGTKGLHGRIGFAEESLSYYSGFLSRQVPSGETIRSTVEHFSGCSTEIEEFVQRLIPLQDSDRTRLGSANSTMGVDALCGSQIWECQTQFLLRLGPMPLKDFVRFLPDGDMHGPTFSLVRYMVGVEYEFEIMVILKREEAPGCQIGALGRESRQLGWTTWLKSPGVALPSDPSIVFHEKDMVAAKMSF